MCPDLSNLQIWHQRLQHLGLGFCVQHCTHLLPGEAQWVGMYLLHIEMKEGRFSATFLQGSNGLYVLWTGHHCCTNPSRGLQCVRHPQALHWAALLW